MAKTIELARAAWLGALAEAMNREVRGLDLPDRALLPVETLTEAPPSSRG